MNKNIIDLLKEKNEYLEKYFFLNKKELDNFFDGDFDNLNQFYQARESLLEIIKYIDLEIERLNESLKSKEILDVKNEVKQQLDIKDKLVKNIIASDLQIISLIEEEKSAIIKELQKINHNKKAHQSYKVPTENKKIDEKA